MNIGSFMDRDTAEKETQNARDSWTSFFNER